MTDQEIIHQMQEDIRGIKNKLDQLFTALMGSEIAKDGGLVSRLERLEDENEKLRGKIEDMEKNTVKSDTRLNIIWALIGFVGASLGGFLINYITKK